MCRAQVCGSAVITRCHFGGTGSPPQGACLTGCIRREAARARLVSKDVVRCAQKNTRPTYCNYYDNAEKEKHDLLSWESFDGGCERELHRGHKMYK